MAQNGTGFEREKNCRRRDALGSVILDLRGRDYLIHEPGEQAWRRLACEKWLMQMRRQLYSRLRVTPPDGKNRRGAAAAWSSFWFLSVHWLSSRRPDAAPPIRRPTTWATRLY